MSLELPRSDTVRRTLAHGTQQQLVFSFVAIMARMLQTEWFTLG
ncbi:hypothetical protein [uncultured Nostoc sp.]